MEEDVLMEWNWIGMIMDCSVSMLHPIGLHRHRLCVQLLFHPIPNEYHSLRSLSPPSLCFSQSLCPF